MSGAGARRRAGPAHFADSEQAFAAIKEGIDMPGFVSRKYLPKFDWGIGNRGGRIISEEEEPWVMAPATSHIHSFRYLDSRRLSKLQEDQERDRLLQLDERERAKQLAERERERRRNWRSELHVRFKDEDDDGKPAGIVPGTYIYLFRDPAEGAWVFERLKRAAHPFGGVLHPHVMETEVPYTRVG